MARAIPFFTCACIAGAALADFEVVNEFPLATSSGQAHGFAFDGTSFFVAQVFSPEWDVFDQDFNYVSTTQGAAGSTYRGISYSESSGTMFVADYASGDIIELTPDGEYVSSFSGAAPGQLNAVAVHRLDDTIWVLTFNQGVFHYDRDGILLGAFITPFFTTGLAIDEAADTLFIMESTNDLVYEYNFDGQQLGVPVNINIIPGNGQGLAYDAYSATLYATTQTGPSRVTVFHDPDRAVLDDGPPPCRADCDQNGELNKLDFICFMWAWKQQDTGGDCNEDGLFNILDFVCFQDSYVSQCGESKATWKGWRRMRKDFTHAHRAKHKGRTNGRNGGRSNRCSRR